LVDIETAEDAESAPVVEAAANVAAPTVVAPVVAASIVVSYSTLMLVLYVRFLVEL
jgi:hypothetical protein